MPLQRDRLSLAVAATLALMVALAIPVGRRREREVDVKASSNAFGQRLGAHVCVIVLFSTYIWGVLLSNRL